MSFFTPSRRLIVEVDGAYHRAPEKRRPDARRDRRRMRAGQRVVRLPAELVLGNLPAAIAVIHVAL